MTNEEREALVRILRLYPQAHADVAADLIEQKAAEIDRLKAKLNWYLDPSSRTPTGSTCLYPSIIKD